MTHRIEVYNENYELIYRRSFDIFSEFLKDYAEQLEIKQRADFLVVFVEDEIKLIKK